MILLNCKYSYSKVGNSIEENQRNSKKIQSIISGKKFYHVRPKSKQKEQIIGENALQQQILSHINNCDNYKKEDLLPNDSIVIAELTPKKHKRKGSASFMSPERIDKIAIKTPPVGYYKPKFDFIHKKYSNFIYRGKNVNRKRKTNAACNLSYDFLLKEKVKGSVEFEKQLFRKCDDVNTSEIIYDPIMKRNKSAVRMDKMQGRPDSKNSFYLQSYNPSYSLVFANNNSTNLK